MDGELKTFDEWSKAGFRIVKGAHHVARDDTNTPLFHESQVYKPVYYGEWDGDREEWDGDRDEDADFAQAFGLPWGLD